MKKTIALSAVVVALIVNACDSSSDKKESKSASESVATPGANTSQTFNLDTTKLKSGDAFYQCEMDLDVLSDKPGNCPKCNMELSALKKH